MKTVIQSILTIVILWTFSCNNLPSNIIPIPTKAPEGSTQNYSGCKSTVLLRAMDTVYSNAQDVIKYKYHDNVLDIEHINAGFNCCPDSVGGHFFFQGDSITILEFETFGENGGCRCLCLFDVTYRITSLNPGEICLKIEQLCINKDDTQHEYEIDLLTEPEGAFIIERDHYPWE